MTVQPIKVSQSFIDWTLATNRGIMAHLYEFQSASGLVDNFTDLDIPVTVDGKLWKADGLRFEGLQRKLSVGLSVDEQTFKIWAKPTDTLFGALFLQGTQQGLLDGAIIVRKRAVWAFKSGNAAVDVRNKPIGSWTLFTGYVGSIAKVGRSHVEMKIKSAIHKLDTNMPRNYYQPGCLWTLFDSGCGLVKALFAVNSSVAAGMTTRIIPVSGGIATPTGADGITNYAQGRLVFTSGVNSGLQVLVDTNDANNLYLAYPLDLAPNLGDGITFYPGCSKSFTTCQTKFSNELNFRGFDKVPPVVISA